MLPGFFDSVLDLIVKTSTDLPPDVRAAMKGAIGAEQPGTQSAQALTIIAQNIDQAASGEGAICQDTGMPTFEVHVPRGADQIWMRAADSRGRGEGHQAGQAAAEFGRLDHRRELRRQPRPRHADHPFRSVGRGRHRGEAAVEGRRLREHEHPVLAAGRAAESRPRRSHARRRAQVHPPRGVECAGQRLCAWRHRRVHRRRSHVRISPRERAVVPDARRRES